ncbi:class I SAM-dependent methyltransferase [Phycicoccus flavus]|uniref:class I SAM-dependent methyltransferase n=1 Tax=Phycicoccus flavus TaxID=2502783 RepID=UPI000FEB8160|nr:class I SAM-dependent methyltransferase [Phycicoccus flavus]NHA68460.1 class I SAM-dependent methyltransferase [Phycicoccus flavus]
MTGGERAWAPRTAVLAVRAVADGEPTRWYEELWGEAARGQLDLPWSRTAPFPAVAELVAATGPGEGRRAVVVGAGLGADAEHLAVHGWATTAFDVAPSAVDLVTSRYPDSAVDYRVADLLDLPDDLVGVFDLVVEVFTLQALPATVRHRATTAVRSLLAPGGTLLVAQLVRERGAPSPAEPPWPLDEDEVRALATDEVHLDRLERRPLPGSPGGADLWVAVLHRDPPAGAG